METKVFTLNSDIYADKVLGCWIGKNVGGTLGGPLEGKKEMNNISFYVQKPEGKPLPNDDLDIQLIWLRAAEEKGLENVNERVLGEYWLSDVLGPWNEYGVAKSNMLYGLFPPLSGSCNNERWKWSNGAWIRSEIWACLFPGLPDKACEYAYFDSCIDHVGEGIYAEMFTASMQSVAFVCNDIRKIIELGIARLPGDSRVARTARLACDCYDRKMPFVDARDAVVKDNEDLGWFQAPGNLGFVVLGLLYGEGDFGKSLCYAVNCGDDTDCTAGAVGSILGIVMGRSQLPEEWTSPIGNSIKTCCIMTYPWNHPKKLPETVEELTARSVALAQEFANKHQDILRISHDSTFIPDGYVESLSDNSYVTTRLLKRSPYEMSFDFPIGRLGVEFENGPYVEAGKPVNISFRMYDTHFTTAVIAVKLRLPAGWTALPADSCLIKNEHNFSYDYLQHHRVPYCTLSVIPADFSGAIYYLEAEITVNERLYPYIISLPLQKNRAVMFHTLPKL